MKKTALIAVLALAIIGTGYGLAKAHSGGSGYGWGHMGNDYGHMDPSGPTPYGVPRATHEFMLEHQWDMAMLALHPWGLFDVALKKAAPTGGELK